MLILSVFFSLYFLIENPNWHIAVAIFSIALLPVSVSVLALTDSLGAALNSLPSAVKAETL
jgi:hypothetical protein